jgi:hypothetical protein
MRNLVRPGRVLALLAVAGLVVPGRLEAAPPTPHNIAHPLPASLADAVPLAVDVALAKGGTLVGQACDASAVPVAGRTVIVSQQGREVARTYTDSRGRFALANLAGGVYEVRCDGGAALCRLWAPLTAPPAAQPTLLLTVGGELALGQCGRGSILKGPLPWIVGIAAAIAVPTALALNLKKASPASGD